MLKKIIAVSVWAVLALSCKKSKTGSTVIPDPQPVATLAYRGADLSFLPEIETTSNTFYNSNGLAQDALTILKSSGMNMVRLRLWHSPSTVNNGLSQVESFAQRIKTAGLAWLLDFHYSDSWADAGKQTIPAAWSGLSFTLLLDSVYNYTYKVVNELKAKNILPAIVQIGNETNSGMLWNFGKVGGSFDTNWPQYAALVKKGIDAIKAIDPTIKIMLHFAGTNGAQWFFSNLQAQSVNFDIIGLSYYPWWHNRNLSELQTDLNGLAGSFNKDIFITETAYPFTLAWNDFTNNVLGSSSSLLSGYDATPKGQQNFLMDLRNVIFSIPGKHGLGFCYWEPEWVAYRGPSASNGSTWENLALFDFANKPQPGCSAFAP